MRCRGVCKGNRRDKRNAEAHADPIDPSAAQRAAGRSHLVLNQSRTWCHVADRARSKPEVACEGTRYCCAKTDRLCRGRHEVLWMGKAAFFGYFLCSSKESDPRPGEGQCK
ncbi:hypothetical protein NK8_41510 [Caballeronia sp. NK8]|nr:hypothetical protein NK8_41510 [Caballeronia sp. NK8]